MIDSIFVYEYRLCREQVTWSVAPESRIQEVGYVCVESDVPGFSDVLIVLEDIDATCLG